MDGSDVGPAGGTRPRLGFLSRLLDRIDDQVTAPIDARAHARGWSVRRIPETRTIEYRDRRFQLRRLCPTCGGTGLEGAVACPRCGGDGVITEQPAHSTEAQS